MVHGPLLILSAALALQVPEPGSTALDRRKSELIQQIEAAAAAEQPVFGIDTQILAASVLKGHDDVHAARFLGDAAQRTLLLADAATRAHFLKRIVELLAPLDARRAESLCASQSRRPPGQEADPLAVCYDQLIAASRIGTRPAKPSLAPSPPAPTTSAPPSVFLNRPATTTPPISPRCSPRS